MEQLVLDPPSTHLRLIIGDQAQRAMSRDPRYRSSIELGPRARAVFRHIIEWSIASGHQHLGCLNPDTLRVILAVRQSRADGPINRLRAEDIWRLLMIEIVAWCRARRLPVPDDCAEVLLLMVSTLAATGDLHPDSDPIEDLEVALDECTGGLQVPLAPSTR